MILQYVGMLLQSVVSLPALAKHCSVLQFDKDTDGCWVINTGVELFNL